MAKVKYYSTQSNGLVLFNWNYNQNKFDLEELLETLIKASTQSLRAIVRLSVVVNVRVFCAVIHARAHISIIFCLFFSVKFNMKSALFVCQLPTLPQKIDSREGLSRCKGGVVLGCGRMNIYYNKPSFAPTFGPFFAKCGAIWC